LSQQDDNNNGAFKNKMIEFNGYVTRTIQQFDASFARLETLYHEQEERTAEFKLEIYNKLNQVKSDIVSEIRSEFCKINENLKKDISANTKQINENKNNITEIKAKAAVWGIVAGIFTSGFISIAVWVIKDYLIS
jgi:hypothetical protein